MSIISENAERVLELIKNNGGAMTGEQLRIELDDLSPADRRNAVARLRSEGRLTSTGATTLIQYHLPGKKAGKLAAAQSPSPTPAVTRAIASASTQPPDQFEVAERMAEERLAARNGDGAALIAGVDVDPGGVSSQVYLSVPLLAGATPELQLMAVLDHVADRMAQQHWGRGIEPAELARATAWLASKYQALPA